MPNVIEIKLVSDNMATEIANKFQSWDSARQGWLKEYRETLQYLYATDTKGIMTQKHDYNNCTHIPKLMQIADVLETYYLESLFSLKEPLVFEDYTTSYEGVNKKRQIKKFANTVLIGKSNLRQTIRACVKDYIYSGDAFIQPIWTVDNVTAADGTVYTRTSGVQFRRISPADIVFDPTASSFEHSPKIIRSVVSLGEVAVLCESNPKLKAGFDKMLKNRQSYREAIASGEVVKEDTISIAGFGSLTQYYTSDMVELLTFYGDFYDTAAGKLHKAKKIVVADRNAIIQEDDMEPFNDYEQIFHARWRDRVDNLWGMGPLTNLLGMQYRIDFLENKRSDIYDWLSDPMLKTKGEVMMPEVTGPGTEFNCPTDGDVDFLSPSATILTADTYIDRYMAMMEVMAGSPSEAAGFRTPGEKTMFEVNQLHTAATRMFVRQVRKFEEELLEKVVNCALQMHIYYRKGQQITVEDNNADGTPATLSFSVDELNRPGAIKAIGSINYADKALMVQTLQQLGNSNIFMDEAVRANFSPSKIGAIIAYATGLDNIEGLFKPNARLYEVTDQQKLTTRLMQQVEEQQAQSIIDQEMKARQYAEQLQRGGEDGEEFIS